MSCYPTGEPQLLRNVLFKMDCLLVPNLVNGLPRNRWHDFGMFVKTSPFDDSDRIMMGPYFSLQFPTQERDELHHQYFNANSGNVALRKMTQGITIKHGWKDSMIASVNKCYKIHLMLSNDQLCSGALQIYLLMTAYEIMGFKYCPSSQKAFCEENRGKVGNPTVVIYCRPEVACAQRALDWAKALFGNMPMINVMIPRYNIHVAGPVYYSGGDGDVKDYLNDRNPSMLKHLFNKETGYALFVGQEFLKI